MGLNLNLRRQPVVGVALEAAPAQSLEERLDWAERLGFRAVELNATGEYSGFHAPEVSLEEREWLRQRLAGFTAIAVQGPYQETFDVTLVSPSSAIRRASLSELWAVCRFAKAVGASTVTVRTGTPPLGIADARRDVYLSECLTTLDQTAREQNVRIGVLNRDRFRHLPTLDDLQQLSLTETGIALDIAHALDLGTPPEIIAAFAAEHIAQLTYVRAPSLSDVYPIAAALLENGYRGMVTLTSTGDTAHDTALVAAREAWENALTDRKREL
jgi:sugar phosphate isomerase/epimerase